MPTLSKICTNDRRESILCTGHHANGKLASFALIPGEPKAPGFDVVYGVFDA
jgi:hypothetical protein